MTRLPSSKRGSALPVRARKLGHARATTLSGAQGPTGRKAKRRGAESGASPGAGRAGRRCGPIPCGAGLLTPSAGASTPERRRVASLGPVCTTSVPQTSLLAHRPCAIDSAAKAAFRVRWMGAGEVIRVVPGSKSVAAVVVPAELALRWDAKLAVLGKHADEG